jgi:5S rRNA maturation endonuclease (ribonuclease M5)
MRGFDYHLYEEIVDVLEELKEISEHSPIIVEGRNDEIALRKLGINGQFYRVSDGIPFYEFCEEIAKTHSSVILFTDTDTAGKKITKRLKSFFSQNGVKVEDKFRITLLTKLDTHQVENLYKRFRRFKIF